MLVCVLNVCVCVCERERDALKDVATMCRRISHWTCVRLREYGEWELLPGEDKLMVDI